MSCVLSGRFQSERGAVHYQIRELEHLASSVGPLGASDRDSIKFLRQEAEEREVNIGK